MKTDTYTKVVLTVIALLLFVIVKRLEVQPVHAATKAGYNIDWRTWTVDDGPDQFKRIMNEMADSGCDIKAAAPVSFRGDTSYVVFVCRKP